MARLEIVDYLRSYAGGALELVDHKRADEAAAEITRLREENEKLREALKSLAKHCNEMEAQNQDYHAMAEDGIPCLSQPLANAYNLIKEDNVESD